MTRIERILLKARETLADTKKERWSDERLIRLIDEAQKDLCRRAKVLRKTTEFIVFDGQHTYTMPDDFLLLDKASINEVPIVLIGHQELDRSVDKWESKEGIVTHAVFDKQLRGKIRLFPIPNYANGNRFVIRPSVNSYAYAKVRQTYGVIAELAQASEFTGTPFGVTTNIEGVFQWQEDFEIPRVAVQTYKMDAQYGLVTDIIIDKTPEAELTSPNFGVVTSVDGFETDTYGTISEVEVKDDVNITFDPSFGVATDYSLTSRFHNITHFVNYGEITDMESSSFNQPYGFTYGFELADKDNVKFQSEYGLTESLIFIKNIMKIYYIKKPKDIVDVNSVIEIDDCFDNALKYYVCGKAFRDDQDTQNRNIGNEELSFYERELQEAMSDDSHDFTRTGRVFEYQYNGAGL